MIHKPTLKIVKDKLKELRKEYVAYMREWYDYSGLVVGLDKVKELLSTIK